MVREKCMRALGGGLLALALAASGRLDASGFALFEQGAKATALAGAFSAEADDPSAMFFNPAGNAFNEKLTLSGGAFLVLRPSAHFDGGNPYPGTGYQTNMEKDLYWMGNGYMVVPIKPGVFNIAGGFWTPFGLGVPWAYPDQYAGRFISQRVDIRQVAGSIQFAVKPAEWIAIAAGPEVRFSDVKLSRNVGIFNPFDNRFVDVAHISLQSKGTPVEWTWNAGIMIKPCPRLRFGAAYHGEVTFDYSGEAQFGQISTGNAQLDALVESTPPGRPERPGRNVDQLSRPPDLRHLVRFDSEADGQRGRQLHQLGPLQGDGPHDPGSPPDDDSPRLVEHLDDPGGLGFQATESVWLGAGFLYDQTPQPDFDVGPLLPDANRTGATFGVGFNLGKHTRIDISSLFLWFHQRTITSNESGFNGTYKTFAILPGLSATMSF